LSAALKALPIPEQYNTHFTSWGTSVGIRYRNRCLVKKLSSACCTLVCGKRSSGEMPDHVNLKLGRNSPPKSKSCNMHPAFREWERFSGKEHKCLELSHHRLTLGHETYEQSDVMLQGRTNIE